MAEGLSGSESLSVDDASDAVSDREATEDAVAGGGFTGCDIPYACESSANCTRTSSLAIRPLFARSSHPAEQDTCLLHVPYCVMKACVWKT